MVAPSSFWLLPALNCHKNMVRDPMIIQTTSHFLCCFWGGCCRSQPEVSGASKTECIYFVHLEMPGRKVQGTALNFVNAGIAGNFEWWKIVGYTVPPLLMVVPPVPSITMVAICNDRSPAMQHLAVLDVSAEHITATAWREGGWGSISTAVCFLSVCVK